MFKKIASIALAAMLIGSTAVIAGAAENEDAVAAADDSAVAAADDSKVAAADDSAVAAADDSGSTGDGQKIYFDAGSTGWNNFTTITFYLYSKADGEKITWGSKKGNMTDEGGGKWSFDLSKSADYALGENYGCIFTADWGMQTCDLIISSANIGDTATCTGEQVENSVDSNKKSYVVKWQSGNNGNPKTITSIGNIIGDTYWQGDDANSLFYDFISTTGKTSVKNAVKYNGKNEQQTIDDTAKALGLSLDDVKSAVEKAKAAGATLDWDASKSTLGGSTSTTAASGGSSGSSGSSSSGSSSSGSSSSGSSSTGSSDSTSTVTSGEGTTVYFIIGGLMLAAVGVFFLARKRREF